MFAYCGNNPIVYSDPSGFVLVLSIDATDEQIMAYERAIAYLKTSETGRKLIDTLEQSSRKIFICFIDDDDMRYSFTSHTIYFDINSGLIIGDGTSVQSAALGLAHEMGHAAQHLDGTYDIYKRNRNELERLNMEMYEIPIATELGEPTRSNHAEGRGLMDMQNSTHYITTFSYNRPWWFYFCVWNWGKPSKELIHHNLDG